MKVVSKTDLGVGLFLVLTLAALLPAPRARAQA